MVKGFSLTQIALHWGVAALILFNLIMSDDMSHLWREIRRNGPTPTTSGAWLHIIVGVAVLALVTWRLVLRFTRGVPAAPPGETALLTKAGDAGHILLYALMIVMPVTGLLAFYGGFTSLGGLHGGLLKVLLWVVIGLHVAAALYHHFILKDGLLNRMRKPG
ncbi:MAG: cytochrome b [Cypionkella sp.]